MKLQRNLIERYQRIGYALLPYKLHHSILTDLKLAVQQIQIEAESNPRLKYTEKYDLDSNGKLCKIKRPHQRNHAFKSLLFNPFIINIANNFLNIPSHGRCIDPKTCGVRYQGFKINIKSAKSGTNICLHQDFAYYPHTNDHLCTISIPLTHLSLNYGTLLFVPSSHLKPLYSHHCDGEFVGGIQDFDIANSDIDAIECEEGSIIVHHSRIIHGSMSNKSNSDRILLLLQYTANDCWPLAQSMKGAFGYDLPSDHRLDEWDLYKSTILSGEETHCPFMQNISVRLPLPWQNRNDFGDVYAQQSKIKKDLFDDIDEKKIKIIQNTEENIVLSPANMPNVKSRAQIAMIHDLEDKDLWNLLVKFVGIGSFGLLRDEKYKDLRSELENVLVSESQNNERFDDEMVYNAMYECFHGKIMSDERFKDTLQRFHSYNDRVNKRGDEILDILELMDRRDGVSNILDIGCGDGLITKYIGKKLNLCMQNIYGCDVEKNEEFDEENMTFVRDICHFEDGYFDLVICLMSAHHIREQHLLFCQMYRKLKRNAILIIRDHDCYQPEIGVLLDIVHGFHCRVWSEIGHKNYKKDYFDEFESFYQSQKQWNMTLTSCGFKQHLVSPIYASDTPDVKNVFFGVYTK